MQCQYMAQTCRQTSQAEDSSSAPIGTLENLSEVDIWSDGVIRSYIGVTAHFVDDDYQLNNCFIGVAEMFGSHTAEADWRWAVERTVLRQNC